METYINIWRKVLANPMFCKKPFDDWHAWEWMLLKAQWKPTDIELNDGTIVRLEQGQLFRSIASMASTFGWTSKKTIGFIKRLEKRKMVVAEGLRKGTRLTIENYTLYQVKGKTESQADGQPQVNQKSSRSQSNNNVNKEKNVNNSVKNKRDKREPTTFKKPDAQDVKAYCIEKGLNVDPERFIDYYEANGWLVGKNHMKDWRATLRNWDRRDKGNNKTESFNYMKFAEGKDE